MAIQQKTWLLVGGLALVVAGCGGGSSSSSGDGGTTPTDPTTPVTPTQPNLSERIEPFDTLAKSTEASAAASAQSAGGGVLYGQAAKPSIRTVSLGAPAASLLQKSTATGNLEKAAEAVQIGAKRDVAATATVAGLQSQLNWQPGSGGTQLAAIAFDSATAQGVRLGVWVKSLPAGAVLRFYGASGGEAVQVTSAELEAQAAQLRQSGADDQTVHTYWSPDFGGTQTVLEIQVPAGADVQQVQVAVPRLSHFTQSAAQAQKSVDEKAGSGSCNVDLMCQPDYLAQGRSVARMTYTREDGLSYLCTGTLLNDATTSKTPYFLTANHCVSTQAQASTLITDWFYHSASCGSSTVSTDTRRLTKGSTLLYSTASTDTSFVQLNEAPPAGVVYAGSYFGAALSARSGIAGVHHPSGDMEKLSVGTLKGYGQCGNGTCLDTDVSSGTFYGVNWQHGTTEGGSSGSALFYSIGSQRYVSGQLYGGNASCREPNGTDYYGRFDVSYKAKIKQWLNP